MEKKYLLIVLAVIFISVNGFSQKVDPSPKDTIKNKQKLQNPPVQSTTIKITPTQTERSKQDSNVLFKEDFSTKEWAKTWQYNSRSKYISIIVDKLYGKVLKISKSIPSGNCFVKRDITNLVRGKKIMIRSFIKCDNIQGGQLDYEIGNLTLEFTMDDIKYYPAVQGLKGSSDWNQHYIQEDGKTYLDNTIDGPFVIFIPEEATNIILYFGLQNCSGSIYFSNIEIIEKI